MRVLLVEDDAVLASVMLDALTDSGHSARHVNNPDEAFRLANAERWDAIVVDGFGDSYMQPDAEYRTAVRQLGRRSPVVVTSARAWAGSASAACGSQPGHSENAGCLVTASVRHDWRPVGAEGRQVELPSTGSPVSSRSQPVAGHCARTW
jgi:CheY-like chemotaxis protein